MMFVYVGGILGVIQYTYYWIDFKHNYSLYMKQFRPSTRSCNRNILNTLINIPFCSKRRGKTETT